MKRVLVAAGAVAVIAAAVAVVLVLHRGPAAGNGRNIPPGAQTTVSLLVSARGRQALAPGLGAFLGKGRLFPAGTTFMARPGSWHRAGPYANVSGVLRVPGKSPVEAEIGLVRRQGRWLVTFEADR